MKSRRGYSIMEIMMVLGMLSVALLVSGRLFDSSMRVISSTSSAQTEQARLDLLLSSLHRDVWNAAKIDLSDPHSIVLTFPDGTSRQFHLDEKLLAEKHGSSLILRSGNASRQLFSQVLVMREAKP